jgi:hypothetical protein|tara:strand:+ start:250 stop:354 length:105 start_codon:yes stop_codon:yes gene_type:complete
MQLPKMDGLRVGGRGDKERRVEEQSQQDWESHAH